MENNFIIRVGMLFVQKVKFAFSSLIATIVDIAIYTGLLLWVFKGNGIWIFENEQVAYIIGAFVGMLINFFIQKRMIFSLKGSTQSAFLISFLVWVGGMGLGLFLITYLNQVELLTFHTAIPKLITVLIMFFYNFYLKRFAFEKRLYILDDKV